MHIIGMEIAVQSSMKKQNVSTGES